MEEPAVEPSALPITCPHCGAEAGPAESGAVVVQCPACSAQFFLPPTGVEKEPEAQSRDEYEEAPADMEQELSELRIRQLSTLRRTAYRTRSYFVIGAVGCVWVTIPLVISISRNVRGHGHWTLWATAYVFMAAAALIGAGKFGAKVVEVQRGINADLAARELEEQLSALREPDFSALSDGSQHAHNLALMFSREESGDAGLDPSSAISPALPAVEEVDTSQA